MEPLPTNCRNFLSVNPDKPIEHVCQKANKCVDALAMSYKDLLVPKSFVMGEETIGMVNLTIGKCPIELREQGKAFHDLGFFYAHGVLY